MAKIGSLGDLITFEVSSSQVLTFSNMQRTVSGRWGDHSIIGKKPKTEFLGAAADTMSLQIFVSAAHGVKVRRTLEEIEKAVENGTPFTFVLGGKKIGANRWVIEKVDETWGAIIDQGVIVSAHTNLTLREYV